LFSEYCNKQGANIFKQHFNDKTLKANTAYIHKVPPDKAMYSHVPHNDILVNDGPHIQVVP